MAGAFWSEEDLAKLRKAAKLYDRQSNLINKFEFPERSLTSVRAQLSKIKDDEDATYDGKLYIEEHADEIRRYVVGVKSKNQLSKLFIPKSIGGDVEPIPVERPDPTNSRILQLERTVHSQKLEIAYLNKKLKTAFVDSSLYDQLAAVVRAETQPLDPVDYQPQPVASGRPSVDAVLLLSDEHADQVISAASTWGIEHYNFDIFRVRLQMLRDTIINYVTTYLPYHNIERLWIFKLGDAVQGDIHGSGPRNHFANTLKAALAVGDVEAQFVRSLVPYFAGGVHVVGVSGNHPRRSARKEYVGPHDNFDYLIGEQMRARLAAEIERGTVTISLPEAWTAYVDVRGHIWALNHGDDVKGFAGFPWYGFDRKNNRVQSVISRMNQRVKYFAYGHYHTSAEYTSAGGKSLHAGNWSFTDPYALESLSVGSEPEQPLYLVSDKYGIVTTIPIYIRDGDTEEAFLRGDFTPDFATRITPQGQSDDRVHTLHIHGHRKET